MRSGRDIRDEIPDGLAHSARGRASGLNPGNRFQGLRLHVLAEHLEDEARGRGAADEDCASAPATPSCSPTTIIDDHARSVINPVESPDIPFSWTLNPYRGCEHGCIYCYARPGHEQLSFSCGLDFETKILVKRDAPALLRRELARPAWRGEPIMMSGVTDPYQPVERRLGITRACLEVMLKCRQPVGLITKNRLITRDIDLLAQFARWRGVRAAVSLTTLNPGLAAQLEPRASSPRDRLEAIARLSQAGVPVTVMTAPMIPGLNDHELPALLEAAARAGATSAGYVMLRLPHQVKALFLDWLARIVPDRAAKVESLLRQVRDGELNQTSFGLRMRGSGPVADTLAATFKVFSRRLGLSSQRPALNSSEFRRPAPEPDLGPGQLGLFTG